MVAKFASIGHELVIKSLWCIKTSKILQEVVNICVELLRSIDMIVIIFIVRLINVIISNYVIVTLAHLV